MKKAERVRIMRPQVLLAAEEDDDCRERWSHLHQQTRNAFIDWVAKPRTARLRRRRLKALPKLIAKHESHLDAARAAAEHADAHDAA
jgi:hypothetical protein